MNTGRIIQGGKFPIITPIDGPQKYDWLRTGECVIIIGPLSDNDGWNGETEIRTTLNQRFATPPENIEPILI